MTAPPEPRTSLNRKKLAGTKWTAVNPVAREKHFVVVAVVEPEVAGQPVEYVDLQAVHSRRVQRLRWRELRDTTRWRQGWH
jgi:tryptophan-rich hypothetical protein